MYIFDTNIPNTAFTIRVSSIKQGKNMFPELVHKLMRSGIDVNEIVFVNPNTGNISEQAFDLNGNVILRHSTGTLFNGGRAKDIGYAKKTPFSQFTFIDSSGTVLIAFDSFGNVTLGENSGKKISVPWHDNETGKILPLQTIRDNLVVSTKSAEQ